MQDVVAEVQAVSEQEQWQLILEQLIMILN